MSVPTTLRCKGQSSVEYLIGCLIAIALLAIPIGARGSIVDLLIASVRDGFARFAAAISVI